jgi:peptide-methionine (S)-S-oxide reductase
MVRRVALALIGAAGAALVLAARAGGSPVEIPVPALDEAATGTRATAVLAGGCFWGVQGVFQHLKGVERALSGYAGGEASTASYRAVSRGQTGHAEAVEIVYDPQQVTYGQILRVFFSVAHDPTQLDRQGPDVGKQYRSAIFYANDEQKKIAEAYIRQLEEAGVYKRPIVTRLEPLQGFYEAEDYHQDYMLEHPTSPYIVMHDLPKVRNFQRMLPELYNPRAVTVAGTK